MTGRVPVLGVCLAVWMASNARADVPKPADAPPPLSPQESAKRVTLPPGFRLELVAAEPLVREPSGVCWDERGRLFVCELHGYNLEGQYDIEALNATGELDREVRRVQADDRFKKAAKAQTYGTVKLLSDTDGDGRMDKAEIWADRLPPCYGVCPARGGVIVACAPDIVYLADRDGDGTAEIREKLFTGFAEGALERGINCPQWGPDNWIYFGRGHGGGTISGPNLASPVTLPNTDFRIKADGSAIEPVGGATATIGFAFTAEGERLVVNTRAPAIPIAPLPWRYLARNAAVATAGLDYSADTDGRVYPTSKPHPWRSRRAEDPGFSKYYTDRYGAAESAPNGYFTSACSPLVVHDDWLPGLRDQVLSCEPAQNLIHRAVVERDNLRIRLRRAPGEERSEFLASSDPWFHPMALAAAPDGSVFVTDFYREIIEDYSAIPRYLQQQYGLDGGREHGRIWRLTHRDVRQAPSADMSRLSGAKLAAELASPLFWRRQTARRLIVERGDAAAAPHASQIVRASPDKRAVVAALYALDGLGKLDAADALAAMNHADATVRVVGLQLAEPRLDSNAQILGRALALADDKEPAVVLQAAMSLGESSDARVPAALARLARTRSNDAWMRTAILSSLSGRAGAMLEALVASDEDLGDAANLISPLCAAIAAEQNPAELSRAVVAIAAAKDRQLQQRSLHGMRSSFRTPRVIDLSGEARAALKRLAADDDADLRLAAKALIAAMKLESAEERTARLNRAASDLANVQATTDARLGAVVELASEDDPAVAATLLESYATSGPQVQEAILAGAFSREDRLPFVLAAIECQKLPAAALSAVQRESLLGAQDTDVRSRASKAFAALDAVDEQMLARYVDALKAPRDLENGAKVFRETCGKCHQAHGLGTAVGPDLMAEFQRAEETIVRDILAPSSSITAGYATYRVLATDGTITTGLLASESASSITLKQAEGKTQTILRKDIDAMQAIGVSLMPDDIAKTATPKDVADAIHWLRRPAARLVLLDENAALAAELTEGDGTAAFVAADKFRGQVALRVTPLQRHSPRISGWGFRIREKPAEGEYRYLRFAWKTAGASGAMIELADDGRWPDAKRSAFRYYAGRNATAWQATQVASEAPTEWTVVTRDLWQDFGDSTLTGIAPTAMNGPALFDAIELLRTLD